jgi:D-alanyl-D-alanine carboxypeptidase/D-alanyl-D-alanine-endopeptidase (penicillin-binding protein 4)
MLLAMLFAATIAVAAPSAADVARLARVVDHISSTYPMSSAVLGVSVVDAASGRVLFEQNANKELAPASNFKLVDAATALAFIGPNYRFRTELLARGPIEDGVLHGDLILEGGGDPILTRDDLANAARRVVAAGVTDVTGTVLVDDSFFDEQRYGGGWAGDDFPYYYQPPIQALSVDEGLAYVTVAPGAAAGMTVPATIEPNAGAMSVVSTAITTPAGGTNDVDCFRSPGSSRIVVVGHYPMGLKPFRFGCAVEDAAAYARGIFVQLLSDDRVTVGRLAAGAMPLKGPTDIEMATPPPVPAAVAYPSARVLWAHESPTLISLIDRMMPPSDNFIAEHLFKTLPVAALHQRGTFDGGATVERMFIALLGLDPRSLENGDGSGLSQGDRVTPHDLAEMLRWETQSSGGAAFIRALPIAGVNGTLHERMKGSDAAGHVRAKTGYIWHVSCLSGFAQTKHHGVIVFSVMVNDAIGSLRPFLDAEDKIVETIVDWP